MNMKKIMIISMMLLGAAYTQAQQTAKFTQFYMNPYATNPAYAGYGEDTKLFMLYRNDMSGVRGAPRTSIFTIDGKLQEYKVGLGLNVYSDKLNILDRTGANMSYSYCLDLMHEQKILMGISFGIARTGFNYSEIIAENPQELIRLYNYKPIQSFNSDFGLAYVFKTVEVGIGVDNLFNRRKFEDRYLLSYQQNFTAKATAAYTFDMTPEIKGNPSIALYSPQGLPVQLDASFRGIYSDSFWAAVNYSMNSAVGASLGFMYNNISFGYMFQHPITEISRVSSGVHEVVLLINLKKSE